MKIVCIGDIYGKRGLEAFKKYLPKIKQETGYHILIVNGENIADGLGIREADYKELMALGVHVVTLGNHSFSKSEVLTFIDDANMIRPINYPKGTPGKGVFTMNFNNKTITVINVMGRVFMHDPLNNPFETLDEVLSTITSDYIIVDVHAEATSEKLAIAHYLDGRVNVVFGTHTHVATNDAMRLPKGTYYITDIGMTGTKYGILGADKDLVLRKFLTGFPVRLKPSTDSILQLNGILIDFEKETITSIIKSD